MRWSSCTSRWSSPTMATNPTMVDGVGSMLILLVRIPDFYSVLLPSAHQKIDSIRERIIAGKAAVLRRTLEVQVDQDDIRRPALAPDPESAVLMAMPTRSNIKI